MRQVLAICSCYGTIAAVYLGVASKPVPVGVKSSMRARVVAGVSVQHSIDMIADTLENLQAGQKSCTWYQDPASSQSHRHGRRRPGTGRFHENTKTPARSPPSILGSTTDWPTLAVLRVFSQPVVWMTWPGRESAPAKAGRLARIWVYIFHAKAVIDHSTGSGWILASIETCIAA